MRRVKRLRAKTAGLVALSVALVATASGCDLNENADVDNGRQLFIEKCGTCHYLKEAGTTGNTGPDLDAAFAAAREAGMDEDTIEGVVLDQIEHPRETDPDDPSYMPPGLVTGSDAKDVATYVASVAGVPGIEPPEAPGGPGGQVFADNGCGACHTFAAAESAGTTGPNLDEGLQGQSTQQIEESIVDPDAEITQGFQAGVMPDNYGDTIDPKDLDLLVDFLHENAGTSPQGGG
jgi:mono/diheme cytochrome c family protein